ncbi:TPA: transcriptional regulator [Candidatus Micrarchaeota archaeon]|nr:transcriptional regulator [Candidatus Micrarchaeota archaeon]
MAGGTLGLLDESAALNSRVFSKTRLLILSVLDELPEGDSATFRELKAGLRLNEGVLFTNLGVLKEMGYVEEIDVKVRKRNMTAYHITNQGREELRSLESWFRKWAGRRLDERKPG